KMPKFAWRYIHAVWLGLMLTWLLVWWGAAAGRYLMLPRPWAVAATMVMISGLLAMLVVLGVAGPMLLDDLGLPEPCTIAQAPDLIQLRVCAGGAPAGEWRPYRKARQFCS